MNNVCDCMLPHIHSNIQKGILRSSNHVVVIFDGGMCPISPIAYTLTLPEGRMAIHVKLQLWSEKRNQASGGNCRARQMKYLMTLAWQTITSYESFF